MAIGPWQLLIIGGLLILLFGKGKVSNLMGELGKGITNFKKGLSQEENTPTDDLSEIIKD